MNLSTKEYYDYYEKELPQHVFDSLKSIEAKKQLSEAVRRRLERAIEGTKQVIAIDIMFVIATK